MAIDFRDLETLFKQQEDDQRQADNERQSLARRRLDLAERRQTLAEQKHAEQLERERQRESGGGRDMVVSLLSLAFSALLVLVSFITFLVVVLKT